MGDARGDDDKTDRPGFFGRLLGSQRGTHSEPSESDGASKREPPTDFRARAGVLLLLLILGFAISAFLYPVVLLVLGIPALLVLTNWRGTRARIISSSAWLHLPVARRLSPIPGALLVLAWVALTTTAGYAMYSSGSGKSAALAPVAVTETAQQSSVWVTSTVQSIRTQAMQTAVVVARAQITATAAKRNAPAYRAAAKRARVQATAGARRRRMVAVRTRQTATVRAREKAAARVRAQQVVSARRAQAQQTASAIAAANAQATASAHSQAVAQAQTQETASASATYQAGLQALHQQNADVTATASVPPSGDTYADVSFRPDAYQGDVVEWTCNVVKLLNQDPNTGDDNMTCREYRGTFNGVGDGEIALAIPPLVDDTEVRAGDDLRVRGVVGQPMQGVNAFGGPVTDPQIVLTQLTDLGHDPNA